MFQRKIYKFRPFTVLCLGVLGLLWACSGVSKSPASLGSETGDPKLSDSSKPIGKSFSIRCKIDDAPESVLGWNEMSDEEQSLRSSSSLVISKRVPHQIRPTKNNEIAGIPPLLASRATPPPEMQTPLQQPTGPNVSILRLSPSTPEGDSLNTELLSALEQVDPQFQICQNSFKDTDQGTFNMVITLAKGGEPVRVSLRSAKEPSTFQRCLMGRCCKLHSSTNQASTQDVVQPIKVESN
jgi:hypothetical protein